MLLLLTVMWMAPDPAAVHVTWEAPAGCGDADVLRERIETLLADDATPTAPVAVTAQVDGPSRGRYRLQLRTQTAGSVDHRTIEAPDCKALLEGAALVVTLAVAPAKTEAAPPPALPQPSPARPQPASPPIAEPQIPAVTLPSESPAPANKPALASQGFGVGIDFGASAAVLGAVWPTLGVRGSFRWTNLRVELGAQHWLTRGHSLLDGPRSGRARTRVTAAHVRGCGVPRAQRVEFPVCAGLLAGAATAVGDSSLSSARTARKLWLAASLGLGAMLPVHRRVALFVEGVAHISLIRPGFSVDGITTDLYRMPALTADARLGVEVRLP